MGLFWSGRGSPLKFVTTFSICCCFAPPKISQLSYLFKSRLTRKNEVGSWGNLIKLSTKNRYFVSLRYEACSPHPHDRWFRHRREQRPFQRWKRKRRRDKPWVSETCRRHPWRRRKRKTNSETNRTGQRQGKQWDCQRLDEFLPARSRRAHVPPPHLVQVLWGAAPRGPCNVGEALLQCVV